VYDVAEWNITAAIIDHQEGNSERKRASAGSVFFQVNDFSTGVSRITRSNPTTKNK
jgi:hypothetical protein